MNNHIHKKQYKSISLLKLIFAPLIGTILLPNNTHAAPHTLSLTSSGSQSINVSSGGDKTAISADNINVTTNCRYGYNLTLSTSVNNNNLYLNGNSSNNTTGRYFSPINETSSLKDSPNTWGYYYNNSAPTTAPTSSSTFSPVPTLSNPTTIKSPLVTPSSSDINDSFNIYYGVTSSDSMPVGTYKMIPDTNNNSDGTIVYNATISDSCISYTVHYNPTSYYNGVQVTGTGTMADQTIYEGIATPLSDNVYGNPLINGTRYYFTGWNTAQDGSGISYAKGETVTDITTPGNTITLYAQWTDCQGGKICYGNNGATGPIVNDKIAAMINQSVSETDTSANLHVPNFYRTNYGFLGWSKIPLNPDDNNFATNFANATAAGMVYGPNQTITFAEEQYSNGGLRLYAIWLPKSTSYTMQTFNETQCTNNLSKITYTTNTSSNSGVSFSTENKSSVTLDSFIALQDARDTNVYTVARLTDGNCWMIENLRLESSNSDNSTGNLAQGYHIDSTQGTFIGLANSETANFTNTEPTVANALYSADGTTTINIGNTNYPYARIPRYNSTNTQSTTASSNGSDTAYGHGNYYNWAAAMANTTHYGNPTAAGSDNKTSETVNTSICPKGWQLPYGRDTGNGAVSKGFSNLSVSMGGLNTAMNSSTTPTGTMMSNRLRQFPNNFTNSGGYFGTSPSSRGNYGSYWTSVARNNNNAYTLYLINFNVTPGGYDNGKYFGLSVRCVAGSYISSY